MPDPSEQMIVVAVQQTAKIIAVVVALNDRTIDRHILAVEPCDNIYWDVVQTLLKGLIKKSP